MNKKIKYLMKVAHSDSVLNV